MWFIACLLHEMSQGNERAQTPPKGVLTDRWVQQAALFLWDTFNPVDGYWKGPINSDVPESCICPADQAISQNTGDRWTHSTVCFILSQSVKSAL